MEWRQTLIEERGICSVNTFVPTIFRHTLIFAASRKLATLKQCSSGKAKYIEKSLHSLSFSEHIPLSSISCVLAKRQQYYDSLRFQIEIINISVGRSLAPHFFLIKVLNSSIFVLNNTNREGLL